MSVIDLSGLCSCCSSGASSGSGASCCSGIMLPSTLYFTQGIACVGSATLSRVGSTLVWTGLLTIAPNDSTITLSCTDNVWRLQMTGCNGFDSPITLISCSPFHAVTGNFITVCCIGSTVTVTGTITE